MEQTVSQDTIQRKLFGARQKKRRGRGIPASISASEFENKGVIACPHKLETILVGLDFATKSSVIFEALGELLLFPSPNNKQWLKNYINVP